MFTLQNAICYDIESFPNCFTFSMEMLHSDTRATWEISEFRDDTQSLIQFFQWLRDTQNAMIGFNNINYDYPVIHALMNNPSGGYQLAYQKTKEIIGGNDRFSHIIWTSQRFAPQVDLFKLNHFDNKARSTSLKALEINMRSDNVVESSLDFDKNVTREEIENDIIPYNKHDVSETKKFAHFCMEAIDFRISMIDRFGIDVLNWPDTKIGEQTVIQKLGDDLCYDMSYGSKKMKQTPRSRIAIKDVIFPYVKFENPEFKRIYDYLVSQTLYAEEIASANEEKSVIRTKGVFTDLSAFVKGLEYKYGVGGIHASVENKRIESTNDWLIRDIDVASLYPSIAIANNLAPHHLGYPFVQVYSELPKERKKWQKEKGKKCPEANAIKLASNGVYGKSNSVYSPFYDPQFTMTITINGQMLLSMLLEKLLQIDSLNVIQANTDGITFYIRRSDLPASTQICEEWEKLTGLKLETADYSRMLISDVNNYIAIGTNGSMKLKGKYWTPDPLNYHMSISEAQPSSWHKNFSNIVSTRAAVEYMVNGTDIENYIRFCVNPFDFMCAVKIRRSDKLFCGDRQVQRNTRFFVSKTGGLLRKEMPSGGPLGSYKRAIGVTEAEYDRVMKETGGEWDVRVCTKNKSKYEKRETAICAGYNVTVCNDVKDFNFDNLNYEWYIQEARKLLIG